MCLCVSLCALRVPVHFVRQPMHDQTSEELCGSLSRSSAAADEYDPLSLGVALSCARPVRRNSAAEDTISHKILQFHDKLNYLTLITSDQTLSVRGAHI